VRDVELLWLEDLLPRLALRYDPHFLDFQSPTHKGERRVETTYYPKRGEKFYCPVCREEFARQREAAALAGGAPASNGGNGTAAPETFTIAPVDTMLMGVVKHKRVDRNYGFIMADGCGQFDGAEYFFHESDIADGTRFTELAEGT